MAPGADYFTRLEARLFANQHHAGLCPIARATRRTTRALHDLSRELAVAIAADEQWQSIARAGGLDDSRAVESPEGEAPRENE